MERVVWGSVVLVGLCVLGLMVLTVPPPTLQAQNTTTTTAPAPETTVGAFPVTERDQLRDAIDERDATIEQLQTELAEARTRTGSGTLAEQDIVWMLAFLDAGGPADALRPLFEVVLPCESGGTADPHTVISPTHDVGRGQVNRKVHADAVASLWPDLSFTEAMQDPYRNGFMSGRIAKERADAGRNPLHPWVCAQKNGLA